LSALYQSKYNTCQKTRTQFSSLIIGDGKYYVSEAFEVNQKRSNLVAQRPSYFQKQPVASTDFKDVEFLANR
jgi:hypothetical protein